MNVTFEMPYPPSVNSIYKKIRGKVSKKTGKRSDHALDDRVVKYRWDVIAAIGKGHATITTPVRVIIHAHAPDKRIRDLDNLVKCIFDSLTCASVWKDDSLVDDLRIVRKEPVPNGKIILTVETI